MTGRLGSRDWSGAVDLTPQTLHRWRSVVLFVGGFVGAAYEVVVDHGDRPTVLILLAGMMGLPAFIPVRKTPDPPGPPPPKPDP